MASTYEVHNSGGQVEPTVLSGAGRARSSPAGNGSGLDEQALWLGRLDELQSLAEGLLAERPRQHLGAARSRLAADRFNLVVLGEFKRGKSTLINALLGREVLPTGVVPLTAVVTTVAHGIRDRLSISFQDGRVEEWPLAQVAEYVTEARNPGNCRGVELARVELNHELLRGGLELVDTPGIGSIHLHNTEVTRGFLPRVDAALCVLDAGQPLSEAERELFREAAARIPRVLLVINKIDHLEPAERTVAVEFVRSAVCELLGDAGIEVFAVSARRRGSVSPLVSRLRRLAADEGPTLLARSVAQLARSTAAQTAQAARFESRAIELPLDQLSARAQMFERRIDELRAATAEAGDLLDRGVDRALAELVNEPLEHYAQREEARLRRELRGHLEVLGRTTPRELSAELGDWIERTVRGEFAGLVPHYEELIAGRLTEHERRYAQRIERILEEIQQTAADVFGATAGDVLPDTGLRGPSKFSFKLTDVEHALDIIVGFGRTITPGALGRRMVIRDAEQRLIDMTDRHAGRLRSELARRVIEAVREYQRDLAAAVEEVIEAIQAGVERATTDRRRGEEHARARLGELAGIERRCEQLADEFGRRIEPTPADTPGVQS